MYRVERAADALFLVGLLLMTAAGSIIAYKLLQHALSAPHRLRPKMHRTTLVRSRTAS